MNYLNTKRPTEMFQAVLKSPYFVDKTKMIEKMNELIKCGAMYHCITRPKGFGKTTNACMLGAYYGMGNDNHILFDSLNISKSNDYDHFLNKYHVIAMDMSRMPAGCSSYQEYINAIREGLRDDFRQTFPELQEMQFDRLDLMIRATRQRFVFILDEYDAILKKEFMSDIDKKHYLDFLKGLLKDQPYVKFAYMTGVLSIPKYSSSTGLNMFVEFNIKNDKVFENYFGFDEQEIKTLVDQVANVTFEVLKQRYDGYQKSDGSSLYHPQSIVAALSCDKCQSNNSKRIQCIVSSTK